jgi:membrane protease YdiL (CAAX protease family)
VNLSALPWDFILILAVLGVAVPWRGAVRIKRILAQPTFTTAQRLSLYASTIFFQWLLVAIVIWRGSSRLLTADQLGLAVSGDWRTALIAVVLTGLLCLNQWAGLRKLEQAGVDRASFLFRFRERIMPRTRMESAGFVLLACTAGISEEFVYRGFVFAVFTKVFVTSLSPILLAMIVSSVWFAFAHLYQGKRGIVTTFIVGMIFVVIRFWSGNLVPVMIAHAAIDLVAGLTPSKFSIAETEAQASQTSGGGS